MRICGVTSAPATNTWFVSPTKSNVMSRARATSAQRARIGPGDAALLGDQRDRAIDRAGVEQAIAELASELLGDGGLARTGGAVDRDDDGLHRRHHAVTASAMRRRVVHSALVAEPATARRWKAFADGVAFALGVNVWVSIVILPAAFVGVLSGGSHLAAAGLPFAVLLLGLARRSEAILLGLFPAALLVPVSLEPQIASSYVYGPARFALCRDRRRRLSVRRVVLHDVSRATRASLGPRLDVGAARAGRPVAAARARSIGC